MQYCIKGVPEEVRDVWDPLETLRNVPDWVTDNEFITIDWGAMTIDIKGDEEEHGPVSLYEVYVLRDPEDGDIWTLNRDMFNKQYEPVVTITSIKDFLKGSKLDPNQGAKADYGKARITLVPTRIIWDIAAIREYGTEKYHDPDNWKQVEPERYRDALCRHLLAYLEDPQSVDKESGFPHLWHIACNVAFLCEFEDKHIEH